MDKGDVLKTNGCFNKNNKKVKAQVFNDSVFFDSRDVVQVKYEMLRYVEQESKSVSQAADEFGFSRKAFYKAQDTFQKGGIDALVPQKPGPKGAHKLLEQHEDFVAEYMLKDPSAKPAEIARAMEDQHGLKVHPRTIHRHILKKTVR